MFRFVHISDLHFSKVSYCLSQFFSKRWLGNLNLLFFRKKKFHPKTLFSLVDWFAHMKVEYLFVTGDITTTSLKEEFQMAKELFHSIEKMGIQCFFLPGNHDHYTKKAYKKRVFYHYFTNPSSQVDSFISRYSLQKHAVEAHALKDKYWLILLDTAKATSLVSGRGYFTKEIEKNLLSLLALIPQNAKIILANHFPFSQNENIRKILVGGKRLQEIIEKNHRIKFYLHGHTHIHTLANLQKNSLPIILDSGSSTHNQIGSFNSVTVNSSHVQVDIYKWKEENWEQEMVKKIELSR